MSFTLFTDLQSVINHYSLKETNNMKDMQMKYTIIKNEELKSLSPSTQLNFASSLRKVLLEREDMGMANNTYIVINTDESYVGQVISILKDNDHWGSSEKHPELKRPLTIYELVQEAHANAVDKGWWEQDRTFGELTALVHSELSEALEDHRNGKHPNEEWYECSKSVMDEIVRNDLAHPHEFVIQNDGKYHINRNVSPFLKPCGIPSELADVCIRIFDMAGRYDIDLQRAIEEKMQFNATRPQRHGGKVL